MKPQQQPQSTLVAYTFDARQPASRGRLVSKVPIHKVGTRLSKRPQGGGGPENFGAKTAMQAGIQFAQANPPWRWEFESDFFGPAAPTTQPNLAGIPSNNFRKNGELYGGRQ
jgi:hypothetical protein